MYKDIGKLTASLKLSHGSVRGLTTAQRELVDWFHRFIFTDTLKIHVGSFTKNGCRLVLLTELSGDINFKEMELLKMNVSTHDNTFSANIDLVDMVAVDPKPKTRPHYLVVATRKNLSEIEILHHSRDMDCRRSDASHKNSKPRLSNPQALEYRSSPMSLTLRALFLPVILYRVDSLVSMHELRHEVETSFPHNVIPESPAKKSRVSSNQTSTQEALSTLGQYFSPFDNSKVVPLFKLLEAMTCANSNDEFNLERLEMLGDSFLKMAVSIHIYWHKNHKDEGKLTKYRTRQISNKNLFKVAEKQGLVGYIKFSKLPLEYGKENEEKWRPPGFTPPPPVQNGTVDDVMVVYGDDVVTQMISDKAVADSMEALIGAYFIHCGYIGALGFMKWLGVDAFFNESNVHDKRTNSDPVTEGNRRKSPTPHYPSKYANYPMPSIEIPPDQDGKKEYEDILTKLTREMVSFEKKIKYTFKDKV